MVDLVTIVVVLDVVFVAKITLANLIVKNILSILGNVNLFDTMSKRFLIYKVVIPPQLLLRREN